MSVPLLMKDEAMCGTGYYPGAEEQTYRMERDGLNLVGTAEVPLTAYRMGEILSVDELPLKFVCLSSCFRREAGAAGGEPPPRPGRPRANGFTTSQASQS